MSTDSRCDSIGTSYLAFMNQGNTCLKALEKTCLHDQLEDFHTAGNRFANQFGNVTVIRDSSNVFLPQTTQFICNMIV